MNLSEKTLLRVIACTLAAGLAVPSAVPTGVQTGAPTVFAEEAGILLSQSDMFLNDPVESSRCTVQVGAAFKMNGRTYKQGIIFGDKSYETRSSITYDVSNVKTFSFIPGALDNTSAGNAQFDIYLDDVLYDSFTVNSFDSIHDEVTVKNEDGASVLKIEKTGAYSQYALADIKVDGVKSAQPVSIPEYKSSAAFLNSGYNGTRVKTIDGTADSDFNMHGRRYFQGVILGDGSYENNAEITFNVENVKTLAFSAGHVDNTSSASTELQVYFDDVLEEKYTLTQNEGIKEDFKFDVSGVKTVRIIKTGTYSKYAIADVSVDGMAPAKTYSAPTYKTIPTLLNGIYNHYRVSVYDGSSQALSFGLNGRKYYQGVVLGDGSYEDGASFSMNVENLKTLAFTVGHVDGTTLNSTVITVYVDNVPTKKIDIEYNYPLANVELDVSDAKTVRIERTGDYSKFAIADIKADELTSKNTFKVPEYKDAASFIASGYDYYRTTSYEGASKATMFNMSGRTYYQGVVLGDGTYENGAAISFNVENIKELSFDLGHFDGTDTKACELEIQLDNEPVKTIPLTYGMLIKRQTIDVSGAKTIRFVKSGSYSKYALADIAVDKLETKTKSVVPVYENAEAFVGSAFDTVRAEKYIADNKFKTFTMNGTQYTQGLTLGNVYYDEGARAVFNVENVGSVSFTVGSVDNVENENAELEVYVDGEKVDTIALTASMEPKEYTYTVSGASRLTLYKTGRYGVYGMGNFKITDKDVFVMPTSIIPIPTVHPTIDPTPTVIPTATVKPSATPSVAPTASATPVPTVKPTASATPVPTATVKPTASATPVPTATVKPTASATPVPTATVKPTASATPVPTATVKPSASATPVPTATVKPTASATPVPTATVKPTASATPAPTATVKPTASATPAPTATVKPSASPVPSPSSVPTAAPRPLIDLSGDGKSSTSDVRIIMKAIVGKTELTAEQQKGADLDGDGKLNSVDAVLYLKRVVAEAAAEN